MTVKREQLKLSDHGYKRLIEHGIIPVDCPFYIANRIVWKLIRTGKEIITNSTIYYQLSNGSEFRIDPKNYKLITHIQQI